ncbi:hypothetical protein F4677DRAFT_77561 [Hypoxylon crocopeplum]|nr:hypothetical protein F4677DRAFT_77561 [Hypoxylon crocopeplum]
MFTIYVLCILSLYYFQGVLAYGSLGELFNGQLADLPSQPSNRNPYLGGGDVYWCCLLAVNDSLSIENGNVTFKPGQTILHGTIDSLLSHQFPCDSTYNGSSSSLTEPQVSITYDWCNSNCKGWQLSSNKDLGEWVRPLISYISPSAIFVLSIPRRRRLKVSHTLVPRQLTSLSEVLALFYKIPAASILVTLDTIIWLMTVFAMSGPVLLSGIYEALIDKRILRYLESRVNVNSLSVRERVHLLLVVLLGNLDLSPAWEDSITLVKVLPRETMRRQFTPVSSTFRKKTSDNSGPAKAYLNSHGGSPYPDTDRIEANDGSLFVKTFTETELHNNLNQSHIDTTKVRLKSMLAVQTSFGTAVGAALVFYMGGFIYTLVESTGMIGDSWTAHNIAFGMFWMIIPHIAIVSSLLLAGNNPNVWQGIVGSVVSDRQRLASMNSTLGSQTTRVQGIGNELEEVTSSSIQVQMQQMWRRTTSHIFGHMYESRYQTAWLWDRGACKAAWISRYIQEYPRLSGLDREVLGLGPDGWTLYIILPAMLLLYVPTFLGGLISYTTPTMGLSCRSMTMLVYACSQTWLILLWTCDWVWWWRSLAVPRIQPGLWANIAWYICFALGILTAIFSGVFGTGKYSFILYCFWDQPNFLLVFLLIGLYRNCLCFIPIQYWTNRHVLETTTTLDNVNQLNYEMAQRFWLQCGVSVTIFLVVMTYIGWWYQRHLRVQFVSLVDKIDAINQDDFRENEDEFDI